MHTQPGHARRIAALRWLRKEFRATLGSHGNAAPRALRTALLEAAEEVFGILGQRESLPLDALHCLADELANAVAVHSHPIHAAWLRSHLQRCLGDVIGGRDRHGAGGTARDARPGAFRAAKHPYGGPMRRPV